MRAWKIWSVAHCNARLLCLPRGVDKCSNGVVALSRRCHDSSRKTPTFKGELRRLYKLVHPDLFHNEPLQHATNEKSFQLLQEYINAAKGGEGSKRYVYHFEFYIRGTTGENSSEKVEISLPPPEVRKRGNLGHDVLPTTRRAIGRLFAACGLSGDLSWRDEKINLPVLFQEASELQRQIEGSQLTSQQQLSLISNALLLGRGIRFLFQTPVENASLALQLQLLERLVQSIDESVRINFNGSTFVFGNCYKVDVQGRIWLNYADNVRLWMQFMQRADLLKASSHRVAAKARQAAEKKVATLMGVEMVFTDDSLAANPNYLLFLKRLEEGAAKYGAVGGGQFSELPVQVGDIKESIVDENIGCMTVSMWEELTSLYKFIEENGIVALGHRRKLKQRQAKLEDLRKDVRLKLRLRHLTFDKKLSCDQLMSACTRLSNHAPHLAAYTEGVSLCISDDYRLPSEGSGYALHMKWDFSLNDF